MARSGGYEWLETGVLAQTVRALWQKKLEKLARCGWLWEPEERQEMFWLKLSGAAAAGGQGLPLEVTGGKSDG